MENKKPTRASQTKQSDSTKVQSQAKRLRQKQDQKFGLHHRI